MIRSLAFTAFHELGVREEGGNNTGARVRAFQSATDIPAGPWPWCAAFVCYCIKEWLEDPEVVAWLALRASTPDQWRPRTARAFGLTDWARTRPYTTEILGPYEPAPCGSIVVFSFSHTGILWKPSQASGLLEVIEGNTNSTSPGEGREGDRVALRLRSRSVIQNFITIHPSTRLL